VDDESGVRHILSSSIANLNYVVVEAENGASALEKIASEKPNLVLIDVLMPVMDGFQLIEEVRIKQKNPVPFIILSNFDQPEEVSKGMALGAIDYIVKAKMSLKEIMAKIKNALKDD